MSQLGQLYFGRDRAESDMDTSQRGLLHAGFLRTAAYDAALTGRKQLIIGRKGSGKSAICMMLATSPGDHHTASLVTPDEASQVVLRQYKLQGVNEQFAKSLLWRYILGLQIAKHVVMHAEAAHQKLPKSVKALRNFLTANGEVADPRKLDQFWRAIERLKTLTVGAFGVSAKIDFEAIPSEGLRTEAKLKLLESGLKEAMADLGCPADHPRLLLLIDQLESFWSNDPESDATVTGLLLAAQHTTTAFPGLRCVVFVRTDIYDALPFAEKDKFHGDEMRIEWTPEHLLDLLLARAQASVGSDETARKLWDDLFPLPVGTKPPAEYLISRTLRRPRDLIQFANNCRDTAEKNRHAAVTDRDILEAEVQYSQWKLGDLAGEYRINYPFLADLFVLFQSSGFIVSRQVLTRRFAALRDSLQSRFPEQAPSLTPQAVVEILYGVGLLGVERDKKTVYVYDDPALIDPDECRFYLHPCFRQALRSTTATDLHPYARPEQPWNPHLGRIGLVQVRGKSTPLRILRSSQIALVRTRSELGDPGLPAETAQEIGTLMDDVMREINDLAGRLEAGLDVDVEAFVRWTCAVLQDTARQLNDSGVGDDPRVRRIAGIMDDEALRLAEEAQIRI